MQPGEQRRSFYRPRINLDWSSQEQGSVLYLTKPVIVWDWDVVAAVTLLSAAAVNDGGQIREISVQVDVLGVRSTDGASVESVTLRN